MNLSTISITPEQIEEAIRHPDWVSDCPEHGVFIKSFSGRMLVVLAVYNPEEDIFYVICARWLKAQSVTLKERLN